MVEFKHEFDMANPPVEIPEEVQDDVDNDYDLPYKPPTDKEWLNTFNLIKILWVCLLLLLNLFAIPLHLHNTKYQNIPDCQK